MDKVRNCDRKVVSSEIISGERHGNNLPQLGEYVYVNELEYLNLLTFNRVPAGAGTFLLQTDSQLHVFSCSDKYLEFFSLG
jgi:hypothetical protein